MLFRNTIASLAVFALAVISVPAIGADLQSAQQLKSIIVHAKGVVDRAIAAVNHGPAPFGDRTWEEGISENDALALPALLQASSSLFSAGQSADQAVMAFLGGNIAFGNYRFSMACMNTGLARSQVSRANIAALQPPAGFLVAFSPDLGDVVSELFALRSTVGCP